MTKFLYTLLIWSLLSVQWAHCQSLDTYLKKNNTDTLKVEGKRQSAPLSSAEIATIVKKFYPDSPTTSESEKVEIMASSDWITSQRADIPFWVFQQSKEGRYISISDPCLTPTAGRSQALLRAWFLAMMSSGVQVEIVTENFQATNQQSRSEESSYKYSQFVRYTPQFREVAFKVEREWTSLFGETFVEVTEVDPQRESYDEIFTANNFQPTMGEYMIQGSDNGHIDNKLVRNELFIYGSASGIPQSNYYLSFGTRSNTTLMRSFNDAEIHNNEKGRFWYEDSYNAGELTEELKVVEAQLSSGIWSPIFEVMAAKILHFTDYPYTVKTVDELSDYRLYSLVRSSFSGDISVVFNKFIIKGDKIYADWSVTLK